MEAGRRHPPAKWLSHVKKTMKANKGKSFKAVLKMAKKTYKGGDQTTGVAVGGKHRKGRKHSRKHSRRGGDEVMPGEEEKEESEEAPAAPAVAGRRRTRRHRSLY
jgi:hypothetical protein